jgi:hypothetical protein
MDPPVFQPYVSANQSPAELTVKAVVTGVGGLETGRIDRAWTVDGNNRDYHCGVGRESSCTRGAAAPV